MSAIRHIKNNSREAQIIAPTVRPCVNIAASDGKRGSQDEPQRALWLAALHSLTLFMVALRKYLKVERCERCGR